MKKLARNLVAAVLGWQVRRLQKNNNFKVIAVGGSVGKTSTKLAIAEVLSQGLRVQYQQGNYNDLVTVPLIYFGRSQPSLFNPIAWLKTFAANERQIGKQYPYDVVVVEIGTDGPGQIARFSKYLRAEIAVITGVAPEHMEYFGDMKSVMREESTLAEMASLTIFNKDLFFGGMHRDWLSYSLEGSADFRLSEIQFNKTGSSFKVLAGGGHLFSGEAAAISEPQLYSVLAAISVGSKMGLTPEQLKKGIAQIGPIAGRMQQLNGVNGSTILDDTYNASPEAVKAALKTLYRQEAPQRIALLGNMNELGVISEAAHRQVGKLCDPAKLDLVVTLGPQANEFIAAEARKAGCDTHEFNDPTSAGGFIKQRVQAGAAILAKGSQNKVFAEEAVKVLLADPADSAKLVRQSADWLDIKKKNFA